MNIILDALYEIVETLKTIITNKIFYVTFFTWAFAQILKVFIYYIVNKKFDFRLFVGTGGMPSSHTALVTALATTIGLSTGWDSPVFMLSLGFASVVISDAVGVRRAAGKQARILNKMIDEIGHNRFSSERLKELLGHTPLEAAAGILIGILLPVIMW